MPISTGCLPLFYVAADDLLPHKPENAKRILQRLLCLVAA